MSRTRHLLVIPVLALGFALGSVCVAHAGDDHADKTKDGVEKGATEVKEGIGKGMKKTGDGMTKAGKSMQE